MDIATWSSMRRAERISWIDAHMNRDDVCEMLDFLAVAYPDYTSKREAARLLADTSAFNTPLRAHSIEVIASYYYFIDGGGGGTGTVMRALQNALGAYYRTIAIVETFKAPWANEEPSHQESDIALDSIEGGRFEKLALVLDTEGVDMLVYHTCSDGNLLWDMCLMRSLGKRIVVNAHGVFTHFLAAFDGTRLQWDDWSVFALIPPMLRLSDATVCESQAGRAFYSNFTKNSFAIVNDLATQYLDYAKRPRIRMADGYNLLWVGRIDPYKHPEDALEMLAKVRCEIPAATLTMVGQFASPEYEQHVHDHAAKLGVSDAVVFAGFQSDVSGYYLNADALICTSEIEGYCLVIAEACACGTPVVAYSLPYVPFAQCEGISWVPQGNTGQAASAAVRLLQDASAWQASSAEEQLFMRQTLHIIMPDTWNDVLAVLTEGPEQGQPTDDDNQLWETILDGIVEQEADVHARVEALESSIAAQSLARQELEASYSYRVGRALLGIPRAIRQLLARPSIVGGLTEIAVENGSPAAVNELSNLKPWNELPLVERIAWIDERIGSCNAQALIDRMSNSSPADIQMWNTFFDHYRCSETRISHHIQSLQEKLAIEARLAQEVEESHSYRIGHAALALPRFVRMRLGR